MTKSASTTVLAIRNISKIFLSLSSDTKTLETIIEYTNNPARWEKAHGLFDQIRAKTNKASRQGNKALESQYLFEEVCVKTLYNIGRYSAPFDPDTPYWIIPNAINAGEHLGLSHSDILIQTKIST